MRVKNLLNIFKKAIGVKTGNGGHASTSGEDQLAGFPVRLIDKCRDGHTITRSSVQIKRIKVALLTFLLKNFFIDFFCFLLYRFMEIKERIYVSSIFINIQL